VVTFASFALFGGLFLLVASAVMAGIKVSARRAHRQLDGTAPTPLAAWRPGTPRAAASGVIDYGPSGPQIAPLSGADCVWWQIEVIREPDRKSEERAGQEKLGVFSTSAWPAITDQTGLVLVDPQVLLRAQGQGDSVPTERKLMFAQSDVPAYVPPDLVGPLRSYEKIGLDEIRLPAGREVFVSGSVQAGRAGPPVLAPARRGVTIFTTDRREQVLTRRADLISAGHLMTRAFALAGVAIVVLALGLLYLSS